MKVTTPRTRPAGRGVGRDAVESVPTLKMGTESTKPSAAASAATRRPPRVGYEAVDSVSTFTDQIGRDVRPRGQRRGRRRGRLWTP